MTINQLLHIAYDSLAPIVPTARIDAEILLAYILSVSRAYLYTYPDRSLNKKQLEQFYCLLKRRLKGEPIAYIIESVEFWSLELKVNPAVLIPRSETELLVEQAISLLPSQRSISVVDLGTGSGAIALALAKECPKWKISAVDCDRKALKLAKLNAKRLGLKQVAFSLSHWFSALINQTFDLIVTNPPYVAINDIHLTQGDLRFEPLLALCGGDDGLDSIQHIISQAKRHLKQNGQLLIEHGCRQGMAVRNCLSQFGFSHIETSVDLNHLPRLTRSVMLSSD